MAGRKVTGASVNLYLTVMCFMVSTDFSLGSGQSQDTEFTFLIPAGRSECFYQPAVKNGRMEVEYQVIARAGLDVGFTLLSPSGYRLVSDFRRSDGIHTVEPTEDGDYRLCFDNSYSTRSEKMVFFEVILEGQEEGDGGGGGWAEISEPESLVEYKLEDFRETIESMHRHLDRSRQVLNSLRGFEARDRYLLEDNLWRVSFWSCVNPLVILVLAVSQVCAAFLTTRGESAHSDETLCLVVSPITKATQQGSVACVGTNSNPAVDILWSLPETVL